MRCIYIHDIRDRSRYPFTSTVHAATFQGLAVAMWLMLTQAATTRAELVRALGYGEIFCVESFAGCVIPHAA